jgi:hypothetical protein
MMIVGVYLTLGVFLLNASRDPQAHRSLIWFTVWSSVAIVLGALLVWSEHGQAKPLGPSVTV